MRNRLTFLIPIALLTLACSISRIQPTAIPPALPSNFDVQTATFTPDPRFVTPTVVEDAGAVVVPMGDAPTHTPDPDALAESGPPPLPTNTPIPPLTSPTIPPLVTEEPTLEGTTEPDAESTEEAAEEAVANAPADTGELDPPLQGGEWDFEAEFIPWPNPYGEPCPGASVGTGWTAFVEDGPFGSSCMNENLFAPNVFSGQKSQEMTFDFIAANSGVYRTIETRPGHRYNIVAYAKHDRSLSPVQMALGIDQTGGTNWQGETVQWFPWDNVTEDTWNATEETVVAEGETLTIFIKGQHPQAEQGGKTVIDNVSVTHLGP